MHISTTIKSRTGVTLQTRCYLTDTDKTDPRLMIVLRMKEMEGYPAKEIAEVLGCSLPRVYQLLEEAKKKARVYLAE